jgi:hypothetical protein
VKEQIIQAVWPNTYVSDEVLRYSHRTAQSIPGRRQNPQVIQTIARRGYRLIVSSRRNVCGGIQGSIAVLPSPTSQPAKDQGYFAMGFRRDHQLPYAHQGSARVFAHIFIHIYENPKTSARSEGSWEWLRSSKERAQGGRASHLPQLIAEDGCTLVGEL